jgi:hypothetical protein
MHIPPTVCVALLKKPVGHEDVHVLLNSANQGWHDVARRPEPTLRHDAQLEQRQLTHVPRLTSVAL